MGYAFDVEMQKFPDNVSEATTAAAIETWLDALDIAGSKSIYSITKAHLRGFWVVTVIYGDN